MAVAMRPVFSVLAKSKLVFFFPLAGALIDQATSKACAKKANVKTAIDE